MLKPCYCVTTESFLLDVVSQSADCVGGVCKGSVDACHHLDGHVIGECQHGRICCAIPQVEEAVPAVSKQIKGVLSFINKDA